MSSLIQVANGFCFGIGIILAIAAMKIVFHLGVCG